MPVSRSVRRSTIGSSDSGVGASLARRLASEGYALWLFARREDRLYDLVAELTNQGHTATAVVMDIRDTDRVAAEIRRIDEQCGGLDLIVANAGTASGKGFLAWEGAQETIETNFLGAAATLLAVAPAMKARKRGHLVAISSLASEVPLPIMGTYGASKAGLSHLMLAIRPLLAPHGVDVTVVHPGFIDTEMTRGAPFPLPFLMDADRAARIISDGIRAKKRLLRFPLGTWLLVSLLRLLPQFVLDRIWKRVLG